MEAQEWLNWVIPIGTVWAALISARSSKVSANAARRANSAAFAALEENRKIAQNDWRIRLMEERMLVWRAYDDLLTDFSIFGRIEWEGIANAQKLFQVSPFLFPLEVSSYLNEFCKKATEHWYLYNKLNQSTPENLIDVEEIKQRSVRQEKMDALHVWLRQQQAEGTALFQRHMSLID